MTNESSYIPRSLLLSAEIRLIDDPDMKAATICYQMPDLKLSRVVQELGACYHRAYHRLKALEDRGEFTGVGRPPLVGWSFKSELERNISRSYKERKAMRYKTLQSSLEKEYAKKLAKLTPEQQENFPLQLPSDYCYTTKKRFKLNTATPTVAEKDRNQCSTTQTITDFYNQTFTESICENVPDDLTFNADETHAEIGIAEKVLKPPGAKRPSLENEFSKNPHITAMVTLNAAGDSFPPYLLMPLKYLPRDVATFVVRDRIIIGGSSNGYMQDENFAAWADWFIQKVVDIRSDRGYAPDRKAILFLDGHVTRNNKEVMIKFKEANIAVIIFPPHMTHIMQPFDTTVARPLKKALQRFADDLLQNLNTEGSTLSSMLRLAQVVAIIDAVTVSTTITNCAKAFKSCGIFPRNIDEIIRKDGVRKSKQSFISFDKADITPVKISGRCITHDDVVENLRCVEEQKRMREEKKAKLLKGVKK